MKRLFLLFGLIVILVVLTLNALKINFINEVDATIDVRIIYHNQVHDFNLEPYTDLAFVLDQMTLDDDVDYRKMNLNLILMHQDVVTLPLIELQGCISINFANLEDLIKLEGIGEKTAQSIIDYRNEHGLFQFLEELMDVKGIGEHKYRKLCTDICL